VNLSEVERTNAESQICRLDAGRRDANHSSPRCPASRDGAVLGVVADFGPALSAEAGGSGRGLNSGAEGRRLGVSVLAGLGGAISAYAESISHDVRKEVWKISRMLEGRGYDGLV